MNPNCERRSGSEKHVLCDAISMVTSRSASRAAHAPLLAPDDAPSSLLMVDRSVLEARLAEDHRIFYFLPTSPEISNLLQPFPFTLGNTVCI